MAPADEQNPGSNQRCCMGVLYMQHALGQQIKEPVCVGVSQGQKTPVQLEDRTQLTAETPSFKFFCVGHSVYAPDAATGKIAETHANLPYCEGIEVIVAERMEQSQDHNAHQQAQQGAAAGGTAAFQQQHAHHSHQQRHNQHDQHNSSSLFGQQQGESNESNTYIDRFTRRARQNMDQLKMNMSQVYSAVVKPILDKYAKDD